MSKKKTFAREPLTFKRERKFLLSSNGQLAPLCISIETVEVAFFTGLETLQILGVEMSTGESNVRSFEAFITIYISIIT
jgi:hypothetical protein